MKTKTMRQPLRRVRAEAGFSLIEMLVSMLVTSIVMGGTFLAMKNAMKAQESAKLTLSMNGNLRVAMDLFVRDLMQVGQGLPDTKVIDVPSGTGATAIIRPGPAGMTFAASPVLAAITVGPNAGPLVAGLRSDMITTLGVDGSFDHVEVVAIAPTGGGYRIEIDPARDPSPNAGGPDAIRIGDLIMVDRSGVTTLVEVTKVEGQWIEFLPGGDLNLNQFDDFTPIVDDPAPAIAAMQGTLDQLRHSGSTYPTAKTYKNGKLIFPGANASRIRMISYYVEAPAGDPGRPRLMRVVGAGDPTTVGFDIEDLQITYDIANGATNPAHVRMVDADFTAAGACNPSACDPNQVRKVNVVLAGRSPATFSGTKKPLRNALFSQISTRNLSFVDQYR